MFDLGQHLGCIWGPSGPMPTGARVGDDNVVEITVDQLPGPMGHYLVAVVRRDNDEPDVLYPLHMMEVIALRKGGLP